MVKGLGTRVAFYTCSLSHVLCISTYTYFVLKKLDNLEFISLLSLRQVLCSKNDNKDIYRFFNNKCFQENLNSKNQVMYV